MVGAARPTSTMVTLRCSSTRSEQVRPWTEVGPEALTVAMPWRTFRWHKGQKHYSGSWWTATEQGVVIYEFLPTWPPFDEFEHHPRGEEPTRSDS